MELDGEAYEVGRSMIVRRIALNGWRNYDFETIEFSPASNVIRGRNAQGKTNLLEAVYMLAVRAELPQPL